MADLLPGLAALLPRERADWLSAARARVLRDRAVAVRELFPQLPRRVGRERLAPAQIRARDAVVELGAWRCCDAAAHVLLARDDAPGALELDLFAHGDLEERTMVLRCLALLPVTDATVRLLEEAQRTNTVTHFEAAVCDSNLAVRARAHPAFGAAGFNRLILKLAFLDLALTRVHGALEHGSQELSRMLQGLATEREAAGRAVWADTNRLISAAPTAGTIARLVGHIEHGDDKHRLAAAEGLARVRRPELAPLLRERLTREPRAEIRAALERALSIIET